MRRGQQAYSRSLLLGPPSRTASAVAMAHSKEAQALLQQAWTEGRQDCLSAWSQAKAWALREVWRDAGSGPSYRVGPGR